MSKPFLCLLGLFFPLLMLAQAQTLVLSPVQDNSLFESDLGDLSNGGGEYLFVGVTNRGDKRRALLQFPLTELQTALPAGGLIDSVVLRLWVGMARGTALDVSLHRVTQPWGEGTADAPAQEGTGTAPAGGDVTWLHRFHDTTTWTTPGGDFVVQASASTSVGGSGFYEWRDSSLVADLQYWLAQPDSNFGWLVLSPEQITGNARQFGSREHATAERQPRLTVYYRAAVNLEALAADFPAQVQVRPHLDELALQTKLALALLPQACLQIVDLQGRLCWEQQGLRAGQSRFSLQLPPSLYLLRLRAGGKQYHYRFAWE